MLAVAVERDATDRRPRLGEDAVLGAELLHLALREVRVHLDLVHRGHHRRGVQQRGQVIDHEVADPDRTDLTVGQQLLQGAVCLQGLVEFRRQRLVQDQQVDLLDAELASALVEAVQRLVVPVVADPDLGLDEDLGAVDAGLGDGLADLALVAVRGGGVDVPVAGRQRGLDGRTGLLGRGLEYAQADGGDLYAVVQQYPLSPPFLPCHSPQRGRTRPGTSEPRSGASWEFLPEGAPAASPCGG